MILEALNSLVFVENVWANAAIIMGVFTFLALLSLLIIEKVVLRITAKTKSEVDDLVVHKSRNTIFIVLLGVGFKIVLTKLPLTEEVSLLLQNVANTIMYLAIIYAVAGVFHIIIEFWSKNWMKRTKSKVYDQVFILFHRASSITIWIVGLLFVISSWGVEVAPLLASLGVAGIAIAFALQSTLGNIFGGISIILDKNLAVGDVVDISGGNDGPLGTVLDIGLRSTKIKTFDGEYLIVPNGKLADSTFINIAKPNPSVRVVIPFGVAYGSDIEKVRKIVLKEIQKVPALDPAVEPSVRFLELADSSLNFKAFFYVKSYTERFASIDLMNQLVYEALNKNKINIPFPQMDIHVKK